MASKFTSGLGFESLKGKRNPKDEEQLNREILGANPDSLNPDDEAAAIPEKPVKAKPVREEMLSVSIRLSGEVLDQFKAIRDGLVELGEWKVADTQLIRACILASDAKGIRRHFRALRESDGRRSKR